MDPFVRLYERSRPAGRPGAWPVGPTQALPDHHFSMIASLHWSITHTLLTVLVSVRESVVRSRRYDACRRLSYFRTYVYLATPSSPTSIVTSMRPGIMHACIVHVYVAASSLLGHSNGNWQSMCSDPTVTDPIHGRSDRRDDGRRAAPLFVVVVTSIPACRSRTTNLSAV